MTAAAPAPLPLIPFRRPRRRLLPGFGLTLGFTIFWLSLIVLVPLSTILVQTLGMSPRDFLYAAFNERVLRAYQLSFGAALAAAGIRATLAPTTDGPRVLVFPKDLERARSILRGL